MTKNPTDTAELNRRTREKPGYEIGTRETPKAGEVGYIALQSTLDRWHSRNIITPRQFEAGDRFRGHAMAVFMVSGVRYDGSSPPEQFFSRTPSQAIIENATEFHLACKALGEKLRSTMLAFCCEEREPEFVSRDKRNRFIGKIELGLDILVERWGL